MFFAGFAVVIALLALTLATRPFYGDLTRIGLMSEEDFGWQSPQPVVEASLLKSVTLAEADVVVLGDSFSRSLLWQAELVRAGLKVKTIDWSAVGSLCRDFGGWLRERGFRGRRIVVQSAERELDLRLARAAGCQSTPPSAWRDTASAADAPPTQQPAARWNWDERLTTGARVRIHTAQARRLTGERVFGDRGARDRTRVVSRPEGCRWFSHRACDKLLLLSRDTQPEPLDGRAIERIAAFNASQTGFDVTWLVVPNKTTVYLDGPRGFWAELQRRRLGPDLGSQFIGARERVIDLYAPNDTHLSTAGFGVMGRLALQALAP